MKMLFRVVILGFLIASSTVLAWRPAGAQYVIVKTFDKGDGVAAFTAYLRTFLGELEFDVIENGSVLPPGTGAWELTFWISPSGRQYTVEAVTGLYWEAEGTADYKALRSPPIDHYHFSGPGLREIAKEIAENFHAGVVEMGQILSAQPSQ